MAEKLIETNESPVDRRLFLRASSMLRAGWCGRRGPILSRLLCAYERLRYRLSGGKRGGPAAQFEMTTTFEDDGDKTRITMQMVFASAAARDENVRVYGSIEGGKQTLERLAEHLSARLARERKEECDEYSNGVTEGGCAA